MARPRPRWLAPRWRTWPGLLRVRRRLSLTRRRSRLLSALLHPSTTGPSAHPPRPATGPGCSACAVQEGTPLARLHGDWRRPSRQRPQPAARRSRQPNPPSSSVSPLLATAAGLPGPRCLYGGVVSVGGAALAAAWQCPARLGRLWEASPWRRAGASLLRDDRNRSSGRLPGRMRAESWRCLAMGLPRADVNRSPTSGSRLSLRAAGPGQAAQESESDSERVARTAPAARLQPEGRLAA